MIHNDNVMWDRYEYTVISVSKITAPSDIEAESWYKYIVGRCNNSLVCKSRGTFQEVSEQAEKLTFDLNSRRGFQSGIYSRDRNSNTHHRKQEKA